MSNNTESIKTILEKIRNYSGWIYNTTETLSIYINEANYNEALLEIRDMKTMSQKMEILIDKLAKEIKERTTTKEAS